MRLSEAEVNSNLRQEAYLMGYSHAVSEIQLWLKSHIGVLRDGGVLDSSILDKEQLLSDFRKNFVSTEEKPIITITHGCGTDLSNLPLPGAGLPDCPKCASGRPQDICKNCGHHLEAHELEDPQNKPGVWFCTESNDNVAPCPCSKFEGSV